MKSEKVVSQKTKFFSLLLPLIVLISAGTTCHATDLFVDDDTCPETGLGTSGTPYCSIVYAITQAVDGDSVYVHQGTYAEAVIMKTGVDLRNVPGEQPKIIATTAVNIVEFRYINNCTLDGFVLDASNRTTGGNAIILVQGSYDHPGDDLAIRNCEITGAPSIPESRVTTGIRLDGKVSIEIIGNTISYTIHAGISILARSGPAKIRDSTVIIQGNIITHNNNAGILLAGPPAPFLSNRVIIGGDADAANIISHNGWAAKGIGIRLTDIQEVSIDNNDIFNSGNAGLMLYNCNTVSPHVTRNTIHDNLTAGINIGGNSTATISNNEIFHNNYAGVTFKFAEGEPPSSAPVTITGNNIHTNSTAGIAVVNHVTGPITISNNTIHQNEKAGIAFFNHCMATITNNDIHSHTGAAGIFTGDWLGITPPTSLGFDRTNGPVELTISRNKIHDNLAGMRLDHASGTIRNNLVYNNSKSGIRFSGNDVASYEPFGMSWGITALTNNTVTDNGTAVDGVRRGGGGGITYDDINNIANRQFNDPPENNRSQGPRFIQNNITAYNATAGVEDAACTEERDYNLYYLNFGIASFSPAVLGGCSIGRIPNLSGNSNEIFTDPLFVDRLEYRLQPGSPAKASGNDNMDMGAYGGSNPITW